MLSLLALLLAPPLALAQTDSACTTTHIVTARASAEAPDTNGRIQSLVDAITALLPAGSVGSYSVPWHDVFEPYPSSEAAGMASVVNHTQAYAAQCPAAKIVLLGWSQGAQCVMDAVCGGTELLPGPVQNADHPINSTALHVLPLLPLTMAHVVAVVTYADPGHVGGQPYDRGTATTGGAWQRLTPEICDLYASKIQSYCDVGDDRCASGPDHRYVFSSCSVEMARR